jgi:hypothetical protein
MADYAVEGTPSADLGWVEDQEGSLESGLLGDSRPERRFSNFCCLRLGAKSSTPHIFD